MEVEPAPLEVRFAAAVEYFWAKRDSQQEAQRIAGKVDVGGRGSVTGGGHMDAITQIVAQVLLDTGLDCLHIKTRTPLELPGYYRPEKKWDLLVVAEGQLVTAMEFKSQVGPSFGNNFNNRAEEAIGSATDLWISYRQGLLGDGPPPVLGYFVLLEDCPAIHTPVRSQSPYYVIDPVFQDASYGRRYEVLCRRLVRERLYQAACLTLATKATPSLISHPAEALSFRRFVAQLQGAAYTFLQQRSL